MATNKTSTVTEGRRRAREAKAALDAERQDHERQVEETATSFYVALMKVDELEDAIRVHRAEADAAVCTLLGLGETADRVAKLTGISAKEVRRIKRDSSTSPDTLRATETAMEPESADAS